MTLFLRDLEHQEKRYGFWIPVHTSATKFTVSLCHPHYDNGIMLNIVRHAIHSSLSTESATATHMLLPNCKGLCANAQIMKISRAMYHLRHYSPGISDPPPTRILDWLLK